MHQIKLYKWIEESSVLTNYKWHICEMTVHSVKKMSVISSTGYERRNNSLLSNIWQDQHNLFRW